MKMEKPIHIRVLKFLETLDPEVLMTMDCYFAGGTAISMLNDEFRMSNDVDFLCATGDGYAKLREIIFDKGFEALFKEGMKPVILREVRADQYGIRTLVEVDGAPLKFEIVREARVDLIANKNWLPVATLSEESLFTEKLLANADRGLDKSSLSKDLIDLIAMQHTFGEIPLISVKNAVKAYGKSIGKSYEKSFNLLRDNPDHLKRCLKELHIEDKYKDLITSYLKDENNAQVVNQLTIKSNQPTKK